MEKPRIGDFLTRVTNHLVSEMILQVGIFWIGFLHTQIGPSPAQALNCLKQILVAKVWLSPSQSPEISSSPHRNWLNIDSHRYPPWCHVMLRTSEALRNSDLTEWVLWWWHVWSLTFGMSGVYSQAVFFELLQSPSWLQKKVLWIPSSYGVAASPRRHAAKNQDSRTAVSPWWLEYVGPLELQLLRWVRCASHLPTGS